LGLVPGSPEAQMAPRTVSKSKAWPRAFNPCPHWLHPIMEPSFNTTGLSLSPPSGLLFLQALRPPLHCALLTAASDCPKKDSPSLCAHLLLSAPLCI
jgi:hypothetical protein